MRDERQTCAGEALECGEPEMRIYGEDDRSDRSDRSDKSDGVIMSV